MEIAEKFPKGGALIAGGAALVFASGIIRNAIGSTFSSAGGYANYNGGLQNYRPAGSNQVLQVQGQISGNNIILSQARTADVNSRLYG